MGAQAGHVSCLNHSSKQREDNGYLSKDQGNFIYPFLLMFLPVLTYHSQKAEDGDIEGKGKAEQCLLLFLAVCPYSTAKEGLRLPAQGAYVME